jgi:hypothetical protein
MADRMSDKVADRVHDGKLFFKCGGRAWRIRRFMLTDALHHTSMPSHGFENTYIPEPLLV